MHAPLPSYLRSPSPWTDDRIEKLKQLWADGFTCSQIAAKLDYSFSRNAVIGKVTRLGLSGRAVAERKPKQPRNRLSAVPAQHSHKNFIRLHAMANNVDPGLPFQPDTAADVPIEQRKTLMQLENNHCRFVYGDVGKSGFFFCGKPEANFICDVPYCQKHMQRTTGTKSR